MSTVGGAMFLAGRDFILKHRTDYETAVREFRWPRQEHFNWALSPSRELALEILVHCRNTLAPYKRIRRIEFAVLPKTISGKIRRIELRQVEIHRRAAGERGEHEFFEEDF
jgi:acyl-CoA synthetase (AMP-forming)/AMP-acid ligase II